MAEGADTITHHTFTTERQPQAISELPYHKPNQPSQEDHTLSYILNWLKAKTKELQAEEQAGFWPGRSTVEQIFKSWVIMEKHLQHQRDVLHNFKKAFDRAWQYRPVAGPQKLTHRGRTGSCHSGTTWELQPCSRLEKSVMGVLQDNSKCPSGMLTLTHHVQHVPREDHAGNTPCHHISISTGRRPISNQWFSVDTDLKGSRSGDLQDLTKRLIYRAMAYMECKSAQKRVRSWPTTWTTSVQIFAWTQKFEERTSFKHLGAPCARMAPVQRKSASWFPKQ